MEEEKKVNEAEKVNTNVNSNTEKVTAPVVETKVVTEEPKKDRKGFCIASLVLGIIALVFFCVWYVSIPCAILAIIFGVLGIKSTGKGMAIAGLITGSIGLVVSILIIVFLFVFGVAIGLSETFDWDDDDYGRHYRNHSWYDYD